MRTISKTHISFNGRMDVLVAFVVIVIGSYLIWKITRILNRRKIYIDIVKSKQAQSFGKLHPIWGHLHLIKDFTDLYTLIARIVEDTQAKILTFWIMQIIPVIMVVHPDSAKVLLKSSEPKSIAFAGSYHVMVPWLGDGLLLSSGKKWFRNRRLLTPAFHYDVLRSYIQIYNDVQDTFLSKFEAAAESRRSLDVTGPVTMSTLDTMLRCAFSYDENVQNDGEKHPYITNMLEVVKLTCERALKPWEFYYPIYKLLASGRRYVKAVNYIHDFDEKLISKRRKNLECSDKTKKYRDFLDILITARDENGEGLTDREIRDEVDTFLFEGHDTTSAGLSWSIYALGKYQDVQQRVYEEVKTVMGDREYLDWDDIHNMPVLAAFIKESMRIYPPVPGVARITTDFVDIDGVTIPPNTEVYIPLFIFHRRPDVWSDPLQFNIDRFLDEDIDKRDPYSYVPFSAGPRNCIGQQFALNELKVAIARLVQRFKILSDPYHVPEIMPEMVLRSKDGIRVCVEKRMQ